MAKHIPGMAWGLRRPGTLPNAYIQTESIEHISVEFWPSAQRVILSRKDAKLLARRITQCLEETRSL